MRISVRPVLIVITACILLTAGFVSARGVPPRIPIEAHARQAGDPEPEAYLPFVANWNGPTLAGCPVYPADNIWNTPIDTLPVFTNSATYIDRIGSSETFHADFGSGLWEGAPIGIPYVVVPSSQLKVKINYGEYGGESDPGPYPIPTSAPIEGGAGSGGDRHVLVLENSTCTLYELYHAYPRPDGSWNADSGALYRLTLNGPLRPAGWTSADAAGLPILPGLARYDEVAAGEIRHALRFTAPCTYDAYVWPARHAAGRCDSSYPSMGQRFRLKASFNISGAPPQTQVILRALKKYGLILADNGSPWYITGAPDPRWDNDQLHWLDSNLHGQDFEAVDATSLKITPDSGKARQP